MCVLMHKHRRRIPERAAVITGTLSSRAPTTRTGAARPAKDPMAGGGGGGGSPAKPGGGAGFFAVSMEGLWRDTPYHPEQGPPSRIPQVTGRVGVVPSDGGVLLPLGTGAGRRAGRASGTGLVHRAAGLSMTGNGKFRGNLSRGRKPIGQRDYSPIRRSRRRDFHRVGKSLRKTTGV